MKRLLPLLLALAMPGCSGHGAEGIAIPPPMDMAHINRPKSANTALAGPSGFTPTPDIETRIYQVPPEKLYAAIRRVAEAQPRTYLHAAYDDRLQVHYVARSAVMNFPDLISVQVRPGSTLVLWSRSVYGEGDLGVNRKRLVAWLAALDAALTSP